VLALLPSIAQWLSERPEGRVQTERSVDRELPDVNIRIKGRIDRWETSSDGQAVLIDFKTTDPKTLEKRLREEDRDLQLAAYAWLMGSDQPVQDARYVALRRDGVTEVGLLSENSESVMDQAERHIAEVKRRLIALRDQSPIHRDGIEAAAEVCDYCAMRGVCRRDEILFASSEDDADEEGV
jgi:ATP-dependent helicase/nuclease subunit B